MGHVKDTSIRTRQWRLVDSQSRLRAVDNNVMPDLVSFDVNIYRTEQIQIQYGNSQIGSSCISVTLRALEPDGTTVQVILDYTIVSIKLI